MKNLFIILTLGAVAACGSSGDDGAVDGETISGVKLDSFKTVDLSIPPLWAFCNPAPQVDDKGTIKPGVYHTSCSAPMAGQTLPLGMGWSGTSPALRDSGWGATKWEAYFDGRKLDLESFGTFDGDLPDGNGGAVQARIWNILADKPVAGTHTLRWVFTLSKDVFDGFFTNPAGTYDLNYEVQIVAGE